MNQINKYTKIIPHLYFIAITAYWFTVINRTEGLKAFPILLFGIPFLWQIIMPNKKLNFMLGISFVCISSYLILAYLSDVFQIISISYTSKNLAFYGGFFVVANFIMALWIIRNSLKEHF